MPELWGDVLAFVKKNFWSIAGQRIANETMLPYS